MTGMVLMPFSSKPYDFSVEKGEQILSILQEYIRLELSFRKE